MLGIAAAWNPTTRVVQHPRTALEAIVDHQCFDILMLPIMQQLLTLKWQHYARVIFAVRLVLLLAFLAVFTAMTMLRFAMPNDRRVLTLPSTYASSSSGVDVRLAAATYGTEIAVLAFVSLRGLLDVRRAITLGGLANTFLSARGASFADRWMSALTIVSVAVAFVLDAVCGAECSRVPFSVGAGLG